MQSVCTLSLIKPSFASEVRTTTVGHLLVHSPCVFFLCGRLRVGGFLRCSIRVRTSLMVVGFVRSTN